MTDTKTADRIDLCVRHKVPFALVYMPNETEGRWYMAPGDRPEPCGFLLKGFEAGSETLSLIPYDAHSDSAKSSHGAHGPQIKPVADSTAYDDYMGGLHKIIGSLKHSGGKTVFSRIIAVDSDRPLAEVTGAYFSKFMSTMRFIYYLPQTGLWFGASPELLIDYDVSARILKTMSLAGTRKADIGSQEPWDSKNMAEHQFVTDFIITTLQSFGMTAEITDSTPLKFGCIEHLCDRITAYGDINPVAVVNALSPTPALCGTPRHEAYRQILSTEAHRRHCYGGWIGVSTPERFTAYVNLRSAFVAPLPHGGYRYNIYVGGGITADSDPKSEWQETQDKAAALLSLL